jgi:hypothetical protein
MDYNTWCCRKNNVTVYSKNNIAGFALNSALGIIVQLLLLIETF